MATQRPAGLVPVGCVVAYLKSLTNTPALPDEFVECNGQTLSDAQSVFNGQVIPNLNASGGGSQRFLRGSTTSGGTGGADTSTALLSHTHGTPSSIGGSCPGTSPAVTLCAIIPQANSACCFNYTCLPSNAAGSGSSFSILPSYYQVTWIMRIK